jgi:hypothetical protein
MEDSTLFIVVLYFIPMILTMLFAYFHDNTETLGDFLRWSWMYFLPIANVVGLVCFLVIFLKNFWNRIKNIKIK